MLFRSKNGIGDLAKDLQFIETVQGGEVRHLSTHAETSTVHCPHGSDYFPEMLHVLCGGIPQLTKRPSNKWSTLNKSIVLHTFDARSMTHAYVSRGSGRISKLR